MDTIKIGSIVQSKAGRDRGRFLTVVALEGEYAFLADGKVRKLSHPKKKKLKHLQGAGQSIDLAQITSDKKLRRVLTELGFRTGGPQSPGGTR